jgi:hypothetical protein
MLSTPTTAVTLYLSSALVLSGAFAIRSDPPEDPIRPLERAHARGEVAPAIPRLDPADPMANQAVLMEALAAVDDGAGCRARTVALAVGGRLSRVRFAPRIVCQLQRLKEISVAQPGFGARGLAEVAAFVLGRRTRGDVAVTRVVVPPFRSPTASSSSAPITRTPTTTGTRDCSRASTSASCAPAASTSTAASAGSTPARAISTGSSTSSSRATATGTCSPTTATSSIS